MLPYKLEVSLGDFNQQKFQKLEAFLKYRLKNTTLFRTIKKLKFITLPTQKKPIFTVLKSPHVHKKSREQFQFKVFNRRIILIAELSTILYFQTIIIQYFGSSHQIKFILSSKF